MSRSIVTVSTPATATALTTVEEVVDRLGTSLTPAEMHTVSVIVDAVSDAARRYTGREFSRQVYVEKVAGTGSVSLRLRHTPVVSIASIVRDGSTMLASEYQIADAENGRVYRQDGWDWTVAHVASLSRQNRPHVGDELPEYEVTYTAGWLLPGEAGRTLPYDVEEAAIQSAIDWWNNGKASTNDAGPVRRKTIDGLTVEYAVSEGSAAVGALSPVSVQILNRYRVFAAA